MQKRSGELDRSRWDARLVNTDRLTSYTRAWNSAMSAIVQD